MSAIQVQREEAKGAMSIPSRLRKRPSQARSRLTVDAILEAADRLLRKQGYELASTNQIARVAGFSVGSLYQYFDDKQAVVGALIDRELQREAGALVDAAQAHSSQERASYLTALIDRLFELRIGARHCYRALFEFESELARTPAIEHVIEVQAPVAAEALQRLAAPRLGGCGRPVDPLLFAVTRWIHVASFHFVVEQPAHLTAAAIRDEIVRAIEATVVGDVVVEPGVDRLVEGWCEDARENSRPQWRSRTLRAVRTQVLDGGGEAPKDPEPKVFVAACLADAVWLALHHPPFGTDPANLTEEARRLTAAVLRPDA
jgi:AcrR family transcriptional regulator